MVRLVDKHELREGGGEHKINVNKKSQVLKKY